MKRRVLLVGRNGRVERIDTEALRQFGGILQLSKDLAEFDRAAQEKLNARLMRPRMPAVCS